MAGTEEAMDTTLSTLHMEVIETLKSYLITRNLNLISLNLRTCHFSSQDTGTVLDTGADLASGTVAATKRNSEAAGTSRASVTAG